MDAKTTKELEDIKKLKPSLRRIFRYSPYETIENLHNSISYDLYKSKILSLSNYFIDKEERVRENLLEDDIITLLFCGYSGNGKTTFLNWFLNKNDSTFKKYYFNIPKTKKKAGDISQPRPTNSDDYISKSIQQFIINHWVGGFELFESCKFISSNQKKFSFYFNNLDVINKISDLSEDSEKASENIKILRFNDLMHLLLVHLLFHHDDYSGGKKSIICFDNLDDLDIVFLSKRFLSEFTTILNNLSNLAQEFEELNVYFVKEYKFIFSLREGTYAELSSHTRDMIENGYYYKTDFRFQVSDKEIINRRLWLAQQVCTKEHLSNKKGIIDIIKYLNNNDFYSRKVFLPLFNLDNRKLITYLVKLGDKTRQNLNLRLDKFNNTIKVSQTGARGMIYRGLINLLWNGDYLKDFGSTSFPFDPNKGMCNPPRVILTMLLNNCNYKCSFKKNQEFLEISRVSLYTILKKLKGIYSNDLIIDILKQYFISHRNTWSHLITIYNKNFQVDSDLQTEKAAITKLQKLEQKGIKYGEEYNELKETLEKIELEINPSGFTCLRYVITHFEYYSKLANVDIPLFSATDINFVDTPQMIEYEFEGILTKVFEEVKEHFIMMQKYYETTMMKVEAYNEENFSKSDLVCKHYRRKNIFEEAPRANGYFHSTRIITKHIGYIDEFRLFILNFKSFESQTISKMLNFNQAKDKSYINKFIIGIIESYIELLKSSFDVYAVKRFVGGFEERIRVIKGDNNDYLDFKTNINIKRHE